jgi:hypothetical protein
MMYTCYKTLYKKGADTMRDPFALFFEKQNDAAEWIASKLARLLMRILRPTPVYIPRHPMSQEEQERVRRRPEHSTETTDQ